MPTVLVTLASSHSFELSEAASLGSASRSCRCIPQSKDEAEYGGKAQATEQARDSDLRRSG